MGRRKKKFSQSFGTKGRTVTLYEREPGGPLHVRAFDPTLGAKGGYRRRSLGHRDRDRAKVQAQALALKLAKGEDDFFAGRITLGQLFAAYERHWVPQKSPHEQMVNRRQIELWKRVLGSGMDPHKIMLREWQSFIRNRRSGAIDARGRPVPEADRKKVRDRVVGKDCAFLKHVLDWGVAWQDRPGHYLLRDNPIRTLRRTKAGPATQGFQIPTENNPRQPVASHDRFLAVRAISDQVTMEIRWNGKREQTRSYLSEILDVVNGTGRRVTAVCSLTYDDLRLERTAHAPDGGIRWPEETDKKDKEWSAPLDPETRAAIDRILKDRPGIGRAPLFPSPGDPSAPVDYGIAGRWLLKAEKLAKLPKQKGTLWHAYRRKWVTEREDHPLTAIAAAGGWTNTQTIVKCYLKPSRETVLEVVTKPKRLRQAVGD